VRHIKTWHWSDL